MFQRICIITQRACVAGMQHRSPSQVAWGIAVGLSLGLIPKDNLLTALLMSGILLFKINHLAACITILCTMPLSGWLANVTHPVGSIILSQSVFVEPLAMFYRIPFAPWLRLNNTLVAGGIAVGLLSLGPTYSIIRFLVARSQRGLAEIAFEKIANDATGYRKYVTAQSRHRSFLSNAIPAQQSPELCRLEELASESMQGDLPPEAPIALLPEITPTAEPETILHETVIEVVRYKRPRVDSKPSSAQPMKTPFHLTKPERPAEHVELAGSASVPSPVLSTVSSSIQAPALLIHPQGETMFVANPTIPEPTSEKSTTPSELVRRADTVSNQMGNQSETHLTFHPVKGEESLRYLLWHININRDIKRQSERKA